MQSRGETRKGYEWQVSPLDIMLTNVKDENLSIFPFCFSIRFRERQMFVSSGTHMTLLVRRLMANTHDEEAEFLDGAYSFFNGSINS